jgi:hypothetical protein
MVNGDVSRICFIKMVGSTASSAGVTPATSFTRDGANANCMSGYVVLSDSVWTDIPDRQLTRWRLAVA